MPGTKHDTVTRLEAELTSVVVFVLFLAVQGSNNAVPCGDNCLVDGSYIANNGRYRDVSTPSQHFVIAGFATNLPYG